MSTTSTVSRFPFEPHIANLEPQVQYVIRNLWNVAFDAQNAIPVLKSQIDTNKTAIDTVTNTINTSTSSETTVVTSNIIGMVNDETAETSYTTQQSDYGAFILLSDTSPIAVTLATSPGIQLPWYSTLINAGSGTATLTPASGSINGNANFTLLGGQVVQVVFDGTDFETSPFAPLVSPALTGVPTAPTAAPLTDDTQIASTAYTDAAVAVETSRAETAEALLAPKASPTFSGTVTEPTPPVLTAAVTATSATAGAATALPATPALYLEVSINGTVYKIPAFNI